MELDSAIDRINAQLHPVGSVMQRLSVGRSAVFELIASGELRSVKIGRRRLVSEAAIRDYIARLESGSTDGTAA